MSENRKSMSILSLVTLGLSLAALLLACAGLIIGGLSVARPVHVSVEVAYPTPETASTAQSEPWSHPVPTTSTSTPPGVSESQTWPAPVGTPSAPSHSESHTEGRSLPPLEITECLVFSDTVFAAFTVHTSEPTALFFEVPVLTDGESSVPADPDSLEQARFDALRRLTAGEAEFSLAFPVEGLDPERPWTVVFNPSHEEGDWVAPRFSFPCRR